MNSKGNCTHASQLGARYHATVATRHQMHTRTTRSQMRIPADSLLMGQSRPLKPRALTAHACVLKPPSNPGCCPLNPVIVGQAKMPRAKNCPRTHHFEKVATL